MSISLKEFCDKNGYKSTEEFHKLICEVDLSRPMNWARFKNWQNSDGTKKGLLKVIELNKRDAIEENKCPIS